MTYTSYAIHLESPDDVRTNPRSDGAEFLILGSNTQVATAGTCTDAESAAVYRALAEKAAGIADIYEVRAHAAHVDAAELDAAELDAAELDAAELDAAIEPSFHAEDERSE
jgi:hypothetical protein